MARKAPLLVTHPCHMKLLNSIDSGDSVMVAWNAYMERWESDQVASLERLDLQKSYIFLGLERQRHQRRRQREGGGGCLWTFSGEGELFLWLCHRGFSGVIEMGFLMMWIEIGLFKNPQMMYVITPKSLVFNGFQYPTDLVSIDKVQQRKNCSSSTLQRSPEFMAAAARQHCE